MSVTLAESITKAASKQTYHTIKFLVDRDRVEDAYRAYAYFRWVDDTIDAINVPAATRREFLERQRTLLDLCYRGSCLCDIDMQEEMLVTLVRHDHGDTSGLQLYLFNMMKVMEFDLRRRGKLISQSELDEYNRLLALAVTEAMLYFIGNGRPAPKDETRYMAVSAAHIAHMLRDTLEDVEAGYYNIPREVLDENRIKPQDALSQAYRDWIRRRVELTRQYFKSGRQYLSHIHNTRYKLACLAYIARFEWLLDVVEHEEYILRRQYRERKSFGAGMQIGLSTLSSMRVLL